MMATWPTTSPSTMATSRCWLGVGDPALDDARREDVLAEERAVALGHAGEEAAHGVGVGGRDRPDLDLGAAVAVRPSRQRLRVALEPAGHRRDVAALGRLADDEADVAGRQAQLLDVRRTRRATSAPRSPPAARCGPSRP